MRRTPHITLLLAAALLLAAGCDPHEFPEGRPIDPMRDFSLQVLFDDELPELHREVVNTKATAGAPRTRYTVKLYRYQGDFVYGLTPDYSWTFTRGELQALDTTIFLPVEAARYKAVGWVDWVDDEGRPYYDETDPEDIHTVSDYLPGEFARDAFFGTAEVDLSDQYTAGLPVQSTVWMKRPVAQLRFIAPEALTFLSRAGVGSDEMYATLRYTTDLPDGFDMLRDRTGSTRRGVSLSDYPVMDTSGELVFLSDFFFCPDEETSVGVDFQVIDKDGKVLASYAGSLPVRRGHHTTVSFVPPGGGGGDTPGGIGISPGFDDEIEIPIGN